MFKPLKTFFVLFSVLIISVMSYLVLVSLDNSSNDMLINKLYAEDKTEKDPESIINNSLDSDKPLVVMFYSVWCGACRRIDPVYELVAVDYKDKTDFLKVDVDNYGILATRFGVKRLPTIFAISPRTNEAIILPVHKMTTVNSFKKAVDSFLDRYNKLEDNN